MGKPSLAKRKAAAAKPGKVKLAKVKPKLAKVKRSKAKPVNVAKLERKLRPAAAPVADNGASVLDGLRAVIAARRNANPELSHSARLLARGTAKVAQKFGEEAVECLIEAVSGNRAALIAESADVLYHLLVLWENAGVANEEVWAELRRREGVSGIAEKASRVIPLARTIGTTKIP
jgi:phosphoribosyl-ATP pyrophosphohydrolase